MKVSENEYECDFCARKYPFLYPINDGEWAICKECMEFEYGTLPRAMTPKVQKRLIKSRRYTIYGEEE
jgi:hypothetical protein